MLRRQRLSSRLGTLTKVALVVGPSGYGKTVAVRQWVDSCELPVAWIDVDPLDNERQNFWRRMVPAVRAVLPDVDHEVELAIDSGAPAPLQRLLIAQAERSAHRGVVVIDGVDELTDRSTLRGLAQLVDRCGDRLQLVLVGRAAPGLPLARWFAEGCLIQVDEDQLRFTDDDAIEMVRAVGTDLGTDEVVELNRRYEGWPIAVRLAVAAAADGTVTPEDDGMTRRSADSVHRTAMQLLGHLVEQIVDQLPPKVRDGALSLSIVDTFDPEMARELLGTETKGVVESLKRARLLTEGPEPGSLRFHPLVRTMLVDRLSWRDRDSSIDLHRRAAKLYQRRAELADCYRQLIAAGDVLEARESIMGPTFELVDRADFRGLERMLAIHPPMSAVSDAGLALDLALASFFAGAREIAHDWCDHAERLGAFDRGRAELQLYSVRCILSLMDGDLDEAAVHGRAFARLAPTTPDAGPMERRFSTVTTRLALASGDLDGAAVELATARQMEAPEAMSMVIIPCLEAWVLATRGEFRDAEQVVTSSLAWVARAGMRPHQGSFDLLVTAADASYQLGDLERAMARAVAAHADGDALGYDWNRVRSATALARIRATTDGPTAARAVVHEARANLDRLRTPLAQELDAVEVRALVRLGAFDDARALVALGGSASAMDIARAMIELEDPDASDDRCQRVGHLLGHIGCWTVAEQFEARILLAAAQHGSRQDALEHAAVRAMRQLLVDAAAIGLVAPFVEHADHVVAVAGSSIGELHPALVEVLRRVRHTDRVGASRALQAEPLTSRETSILELLPTYLSYAEIGERLFVSVNTVKSNLKSVYRKLGATSRSEAVEIARTLGLI